MKNQNSNGNVILGNLWKKTTKDGQPYLSGSLKLDSIRNEPADEYGQVRVSIFKSKNKRKETDSDMVVFFHPMEGEAPRKAVPAKSFNKRPAPVKQESPFEDDDLL